MNAFTSFFARMNERTKLLLVGAVAFSVGMMLRGSGGATSGRYQACGNSPAYVLDTQKGVAWELRNGRYERMAAMPW